uniref:Uncharacterized protein n=1 Tax=Rhizophora mucronata TaxID=61149 RepID=A0A2P2JBK2_RHIMU
MRSKSTKSVSEELLETQHLIPI